MASIKESFTKGITAINVKTNNFMEQSKCKTYISTLENEIGDLKAQIGNVVYDKYVVNEFKPEDVEEYCTAITAKYQEIQKQKDKIQQLLEEEKQILGTQQHTAAPASEKAENTIFCSQCGAQNASNYKFCAKCGAPLA